MHCAAEGDSFWKVKVSSGTEFASMEHVVREWLMGSTSMSQKYIEHIDDINGSSGCPTWEMSGWKVVCLYLVALALLAIVGICGIRVATKLAAGPLMRNHVPFLLHSADA